MLIERKHVFDQLRELNAGRRDAPRVAVISGPAAAGKTEVLNAYCRVAGDDFGCVVLAATCAADERDLPLGLIGQLFEGDSVPTEGRDRVRRALAAVPPSAAAPDADACLGPAVAHVAQEAMCVLQDISDSGPVILSVDDVHHGDFVSLQVLLFLLRRLSSGRYQLIVTDTPHVRATHSHLRSELARWSCFYSVTVELLSNNAVGQLLAATLGDRVEDDDLAALVPAVLDATGGNPLLLQGALKDIAGEVAAAGSGPGYSYGENEMSVGVPSAETVGTGAAFRTAALSLLLRLGADLRPVATAVAMLGTDVDEASVSDLLDLPVDVVATALSALEACGILGEQGFRHPAVAAVVLDSVDPELRSRLQVRAAEVVHQHGGDAVNVAEHFVAAGVIPGPWAVRVLVDAAADAQSSDDIGLAADFLDLAGRNCSDDVQRARTTLNLARIEWRSEPSSAARHLDDLLAAVRAGQLDAMETTMVVRWLLWIGRTDDADEAIELLLALAGVSEPAVAAELASLRRWYPGRIPERAVAVAPGSEHIAPPAYRASVALHATLTEGGSNQAVAQALQVLADCELADSTLPTIVCALQTLIHADRHALSATWCRNLIRVAEDRHAASWEAVLAAVRADAALRHGDLNGAQKWSSFALNRISRRSWGTLVGFPIAIRMQALVGLGEYDEAATLSRQVVPEQLFETSYGLRYLRARGELHLATNRLHAAQSDFTRWGELARQWGCDLPSSEPWRSSLARVQLRLQRPGAARELTVEQLNRPGGKDPRVRGETLRVIAAASDVRRRPAILREAVDLLQAAGDRVELAFAMADLSRAHTALGDFNRARLMSRRALEVAGECGAEKVCRWMLGGQQDTSEVAEDEDAEATEAAERAIDVLSDAERRVAELAVMGHTNREISAKLFITVSTVEQHLTRIYRKLGVSRRADLPLRLPTSCHAVPSFAPAVNG